MAREEKTPKVQKELEKKEENRNSKGSFQDDN